MNRHKGEEAVVFGALLALGVVLRWQLQPWPNTFPALAVALFSGFYFRSALVAGALPVLVMAMTDMSLNGYDPLVRMSVYTMIVAPVLARGLLRGRGRLFSRNLSYSVRRWAALLGCTWGSVLAFFVVTNFAVFLAWHDPTWSELRRCYVQALPFLRSMWIWNTLGAVVLFGGYQLAAALRPVAVAPPAGQPTECAE